MGIILRLDTVVNLVLVLGTLAVLVQREAQPVTTLMSDGEIREDEVSCG
jgi:hypothetical protein